jgi:hypothetical protein
MNISFNSRSATAYYSRGRSRVISASFVDTYFGKLLYELGVEFLINIAEKLLTKAKSSIQGKSSKFSEPAISTIKSQVDISDEKLNSFLIVIKTLRPIVNGDEKNIPDFMVAINDSFANFDDFKKVTTLISKMGADSSYRYKN